MRQRLACRISESEYPLRIAHAKGCDAAVFRDLHPDQITSDTERKLDFVAGVSLG